MTAPLRVVLVSARPSEGDQALAAALDAIAAYGWSLVGLVPPERHIEALQMIVDGEADAVLAARPEDLPSVMITPYLPSPIGDTGPRNQRTRVVQRSSQSGYTQRLRRPGPVA